MRRFPSLPLAAAFLLALSGILRAADPTAAIEAAPAKNPAWLTELSVADKESYDDNVLLVSGLGMPVESSWVNTVSFKLGLDFAPLLDAGSAVQSATFVYQPDRSVYASASAENYTAHKLNDLLKGKIGDFSYSLDNAFLYVDGNKLAETYALNQLTGAGANQNDKYRNNYTHGVPRERRNQDQDRYTAFLRWDTTRFFFRAISAMTWYDLNTYLFNTSHAPYLGYQDYIDRWDINGGADLGVKITKDFAFTIGYRDGDQHQDQYALALNSDQHYSSNHYQRILFGLEGKVNSWLNVKLSGGPDIRDFNPNTPISRLRTTRFYGDATATATLSTTQSLTFAFRQGIFVSSTGLVPYDDISYGLVYRWSATKKLGFDLGAKFLEGNYKLGNDITGSAPSLRDDVDVQGSAGFSYLIVPHLTATLAYTYDKGQNDLDSLPANLEPGYRSFKHNVTSLGLKYAF